MFHKKINDRLSLSQLSSDHASELFALTNRNRAFLRPWLPWVDGTQQQQDTEEFIRVQHELFIENKAIHLSILFCGDIAGVVGMDEIDSANDIGHIGYWLGEEYTGRGLMTLAVKELISLGFEHYSLNRIEIQCATENVKSRAIPERLGFTQEGTLRAAEKVNGSYLDLVAYGYLKSEV